MRCSFNVWQWKLKVNFRAGLLEMCCIEVQYFKVYLVSVWVFCFSDKHKWSWIACIMKLIYDLCSFGLVSLLLLRWKMRSNGQSNSTGKISYSKWYKTMWNKNDKELRKQKVYIYFFTILHLILRLKLNGHVSSPTCYLNGVNRYRNVYIINNPLQTHPAPLSERSFAGFSEASA